MPQPIIGITTFISEKGLTLPTTYIDAINDSDGVPMVLAKTEDPGKIKTQIDNIDALLLTGGNDIEPALFGEEPHRELGEIEPGRDAYESALIEHALEKGIPILGICRGAQILNIQQGGTMYQDIYSQMEAELNQHTQKAARNYLAHTVDIEAGSLLHRIVGETSIKTNTFHHQANKDVPDHFIISGLSPDGVVEAVESTVHDFVIGLQWHPEGTYFNDEASKKIFQAFVAAAVRQYA
ncbi:gamma-glutamyl-gamma-aminobutyrate hydrolase family protein [Salinicoccus halitifaciens]|uniref:Glutamine amidotransferase n=1 Tax=Salinicoccus halitifaciens TaxID=1073415 RepID=A0ABV2EBX1_9STAP|nr:gamma-glutamyl-gamma-aminobutyrate hydrolase family protein [Salinicoccus halitifaciens]MCD2137424.1 gamma-glutamyl-gamma-aminobutyrate hydrolase family protein [Salinicoccus halitifaciens]